MAKPKQPRRTQSRSLFGSVVTIGLIVVVWWINNRTMPAAPVVAPPATVTSAPTVQVIAQQATQLETETTDAVMTSIPSTATLMPDEATVETPDEEQPAATAPPTDAPTAKPTPVPTATPAPTATPRPQPTPTATPRGPPGMPVLYADELPSEAWDTLDLIFAGGPFPYRQDDGTFQNREGMLPRKPRDYYREYTVETPGSPDRGARRIVQGAEGELYYTDDHYASFSWIELE